MSSTPTPTPSPDIDGIILSSTWASTTVACSSSSDGYLLYLSCLTYLNNTQAAMAACSVSGFRWFPGKILYGVWYSRSFTLGVKGLSVCHPVFVGWPPLPLQTNSIPSSPILEENGTLFECYDSIQKTMTIFRYLFVYISPQKFFVSFHLYLFHVSPHHGSGDGCLAAVAAARRQWRQHGGSGGSFAAAEALRCQLGAMVRWQQQLGCSGSTMAAAMAAGQQRDGGGGGSLASEAWR